MSNLLTDKADTTASNSKKRVSFQKPKKTRRGKKKPKSLAREKQIKDETRPPDGDQNFPIWSPNDPDFSTGAMNVVIRPIDAPKAPKNSTQFIIDDHDEYHLYFNFEKPSSEHPIITSPSNDAAIVGIDYEYHSMQDLDTSAFYLNDFEDSYNNMRYEELMRLDHDKIMSNLEQTESMLKELDQKFYETDPNTALEQLQHKLLQLQEENTMLQKSNKQFKELLKPQSQSHSVETTDSATRGDDSHSEQLCDASGESVEDESEDQPTTNESEQSACEEQEVYTNGSINTQTRVETDYTNNKISNEKTVELNCEKENSGYLADTSHLVDSDAE